MIKPAAFRKLALALPETEESEHFGQPDFRVRGKIFADLSPDGKQGTLKLTPELQAMALSGWPGAFFPAAGAWGRHGWTRVWLGKIDKGSIAGLIVESFRLVAPKRLRDAGKGAEAKAPARAKKASTRKSGKPRAPAKPAGKRAR